MRVEDWPIRLQLHLDNARDQEFRWGRHDCALWSARWVAECTGEDHFTSWLGNYTSKAGAFREMRARGFDGVAGVASHHLSEKPVASAQRGDLVLDPNGCLGICVGLKSHFVTSKGLLMHDTLACVMAWEVG